MDGCGIARVHVAGGRLGVFMDSALGTGAHTCARFTTGGRCYQSLALSTCFEQFSPTTSSDLHERLIEKKNEPKLDDERVDHSCCDCYRPLWDSVWRNRRMVSCHCHRHTSECHVQCARWCFLHVFCLHPHIHIMHKVFKNVALCHWGLIVCQLAKMPIK